MIDKKRIDFSLINWMVGLNDVKSVFCSKAISNGM